MKVAFFDLDGTLLPGDSDHAFGEFLVRTGWADEAEFKAGNDRFYQDYLAGRLDIHAYVRFATAPWRHRDSDELEDALERFVIDFIHPMLKAPAVELVQRHREAGDVLAIVTSTNEFVTRPIADVFGIDILIATELERDARGAVTGNILGVPAYREGKVQRVGDWLRAQGLDWADLEQSVFYSDSTNDLPLLERVKVPVATNPGEALERIARERGWPILKLFE